ncbi:DUF1983 domain-containing protein, partial [Xenorhabdus sp. DI]|uniref:phage tail tip fiber protein n=1 Tax=Xenorhabdus doucetiae TaxID=351671 RepID=UPI0019919794
RGESSSDASWIVQAAGNQFLSAEAGKRLGEQLDYLAEADLINGAAIQENAFELMARDGENKAEIQRLDRVFADEKEAWAQSFKKVESSVGENRASILENQKTVNKLDSSMADNERRTQAQFDKQSAIIREKATAVFDINGNGYAVNDIGAGVMYNGQFYKAGMVIGAEVKNGRVETHFGVSANQFTVVNPNNGKLEPVFIIKNGQVFTNSQFIEDGSITNAKIGNYIQSRDYTAGRSGWKIDKGGFAEFGNIKARGEINATSGSLRNVTIEEDCKINGTLSVNNIVGDIVKVYTMREGNLTIPPSPFDRVVVIPALQITAKSSKQAWVSLNGNEICRARTSGASMSGYSNGGHVSVSGYVPSVITGYGTLPKNTRGDIRYYQEGDSFMITILVFKA